jgi:hypothetical protein
MPAYYNATDADVEYRATLRIFDLLRATGLWVVYERHVLEIDVLFARMSAAGMPTDHGVRLEKAKLIHKMLEEVDAKIQAVVPIEVHPHHPKTGYKKLKPVEGGEDQWVVLASGLWARRLPFVPSAGPNGGLTRYQDHLGHIPVRVQGKRTTDEAAIQRLMLRYQDDPLYPLVLQRQEIVKLGGTYVGKPRDDGTSGVVGGIRADSTGRVHTHFTHNPSTLRTSAVAPNLQQIPRAHGLGAVVKAFFIAPPGYLLGEVDYAGIEALLVGHFAHSDRYMRLARLGVHDYVNAHALYMLDGILTAGDMPDLSWSDADLAGYFAALKLKFPEERQVRKRMVHARNYMVGWKETQQVLIKEQGRVIPAAEIKKFLRFYDDLFPEIGQRQRSLYEIVGGVGRRDVGDTGGDRASEERSGDVLRRMRPGDLHDNSRPESGTREAPGSLPEIYGSAGPGWIRNPYGYLHRYNRAVTWERVGDLWQPHPGEDAKRLIAFQPQSTAAAIIKEALLRASADEEIMACMRLLIHDSFVLELPEARAGDILARLAHIMQQPNPELGGLQVGTETKVGKSWAALK